MSVQAVVPIPPPQPAHPPAPSVTTVDVEAQVSIEEAPEVADGEAQVSLGPSQEHEARVARFTEYLLHGPPGHREPPTRGLVPPLTAWPLPSDLAEIDTMLAQALGGPPPSQPPPPESTETSTMAFSSSGLDDLSLGEVRSDAPSPGELQQPLGKHEQVERVPSEP